MFQKHKGDETPQLHMVAHFLRVHLQALTGPGEACSSFFSEVMAYIKQLLSLFSIFKHVKIACEPQSSWGIRALCASPVPRPSPVNQRHLRREGRKKSPILESVSFLNHSKPSVLNSFQLPAHQMHSAILGDNFRLIFYAAFKVRREKILISETCHAFIGYSGKCLRTAST